MRSGAKGRGSSLKENFLELQGGNGGGQSLGSEKGQKSHH